MYQVEENVETAYQQDTIIMELFEDLISEDAFTSLLSPSTILKANL